MTTCILPHFSLQNQLTIIKHRSQSSSTQSALRSPQNGAEYTEFVDCISEGRIIKGSLPCIFFLWGIAVSARIFNIASPNNQHVQGYHHHVAIRMHRARQESHQISRCRVFVHYHTNRMCQDLPTHRVRVHQHHGGGGRGVFPGALQVEVPHIHMQRFQLG